MEKFSKTKYNNQQLKDLGFDPKMFTKGKRLKSVIRECHRKLGFLENCIGGNSQNIGGQIEAYNNILCVAEGKVSRETKKRCPICQELCPEDDMIDTEGMVNGGIGTICPDCAENGDVGR